MSGARKLVEYEPTHPLGLTEGGIDDAHGVARPAGPLAGLRNALSNFFYQDAIGPVTPAELAAAHSHGELDELDGPEEAARLAQHGSQVNAGAGESFGEELTGVDSRR